MPKAYEAMRDKFAAEGMDYDAAQGKAARIYNSKHPKAPVGRSENLSDLKKYVPQGPKEMLRPRKPK